jgi:ribosomal protein L37E
MHPLFDSIFRAHFPAIPRSVEAGECETCGADSWSVQNDSFDHQFGTEAKPDYLECRNCGRTKPAPEYSP